MIVPSTSIGNFLLIVVEIPLWLVLGAAILQPVTDNRFGAASLPEWIILVDCMQVAIYQEELLP
jgi:hypothetical protein